MNVQGSLHVQDDTRMHAVHVCKTMPTCNTMHVQDGVQASSVCKPAGIRQGMQACKVMQVCKTMLACKTLRVQGDVRVQGPPPAPSTHWC